MSVLPYLPLLAAWTVAVVSPGPDFLAVLRTSIGRSRRAGVLVACGVVTGILCWALAALAGLTALLARYEQAYLVLRWAGALFLVGYGLTTLRSTWRRAPVPETAPDATGAVPAGAWPAWRLGLLTNLANPKAVIFFGSLFAGLLPPTAGLLARAEVLAAMLAIALSWLVTVAVLASFQRAVAVYRKGRKAVDTVTGGLFVAAGAALAPH